MGIISPDLSGIVDGAVADATDFTTPFNTITNAINGGLDNDNVSSGAGINFSKLESSTWTTFSPALYKADGVTSLTGSVNTFRYVKIGRIVIIQFAFVSVANPSGALVYFDLPIAARVDTSDTRPIGTGYIAAGGAESIGYVEIAQNGSALARIARFDRSNWATSTTNGAKITCTYESAS